MNKLKHNVDYVLTTHYVDLCEKLDNDPVICNKKMNTIVDKESNKYEYKYELVDGVSYINGGYQILVDLNYPTHLLNDESPDHNKSGS